MNRNYIFLIPQIVDATPISPILVVLPYAKPFPGVSIIKFSATGNFEWWQEFGIWNLKLKLKFGTELINKC